ncbi:DUF2188 domain-containing protein [Bacillus sp. FJAT-45037]
MSQNDQWTIKKKGADRANKTFDTKDEALEYGDQQLAKRIFN